MKLHFTKLSLLSSALCACLSTQAQVIFHEDFGNNPSRVPTPYVPAGYSYKFADTAGISSYLAAPLTTPTLLISNVTIDNGYYAVVPIQNIGQGYLNASNFTWRWTGSRPYPANTLSGGQESTTVVDASAGYGGNGSVLVVNGGYNPSEGEVPSDGFKPIYARTVRLAPGTKYKASYKYYVVNGGNNIRLAVRDGITYGAYYNKDVTSSDFARSENRIEGLSPNAGGVWKTGELIFQTKSDCGSGNYEILLFNMNSSTLDNDYYVDEIKLEVVSTTGGTLISNCPTIGQVVSGTVIDQTSTGDLDLSSYYVSLIDDKGDIIMTVQVNGDGTYIFNDVMYNTFNVVIHKDPSGKDYNDIEPTYAIVPAIDATSSPFEIDATTTRSDLDIAIYDIEPLSYHDIMFNAHVEESTVALTWKVTQGQYLQKFIIERSTDAQNWLSIGELRASNRVNAAEYAQYDLQPHSGKNYYRIKCIDYNNEVSYSLVQSVFVDINVHKISLYPNPAQNQIHIEGLGKGQVIHIYNTQGQLVQTCLSSNDVNTLDISQWATGMYFIRVNTGENSQRLSFQKL